MLAFKNVPGFESGITVGRFKTELAGRACREVYTIVKVRNHTKAE